MNDKVIIMNKKRGQTPLECINEIKKSEPKLAHVPLTYAGRLDPLAEGVLVILIGDECLKKDEYLKLSKVYEVKILFGFATDTYDMLGKITEIKNTEELFDFSQSGSSSFLIRGPEKLNNSEVLNKIISQFTGRIKQSYPPYSSRTVNGKPLYQWAREGKLGEITIPSHDVSIEKIEIIKNGFISGQKLFDKIKKDTSLVAGDFRQKEILNLWIDVLKDKKEKEFKTISLRVTCGSGVYVRGIAHELGVALGISALALKIKRTKVGDYKL